MGVVTYFLLCGYTPFGTFQSSRVYLSWPSKRSKLTKTSPPPDRENQVDEVQAICNGDYAFEPAEYWVGVSETGALARKSSPHPPATSCFDTDCRD
jgi:calcium/calmodulin-dependent protein kinase I